MGNVGSRLEEGFPLYLRDQNRFAVASVTVSNSRNRTLLYIIPNAHPATRYTPRREQGDDSLIEYVQDPETVSSSSSQANPPTFLLRLPSDDDLIFDFKFTARQAATAQGQPAANGAAPASTSGATDTTITGLTFMFGSTGKELDSLATKEFYANPNLHKRPNVELIGDYSTAGSTAIQFSWQWKWKPPKQMEDRGGGWRTSCSFFEYDLRAHKLESLASLCFWVQAPLQNSTTNSPRLAVPKLDELGGSSRLRVPSGQSVESRLSDSDGPDSREYREYREPQSPTIEAIPENPLSPIPSSTTGSVKVDVICQKPGEDPSAVDDGPVFRAMIKQLEQRTGTMRVRMKKVLRKAEAAHEAQTACNEAVAAFMDALHEAALSNQNAVKPAMDHYFEKIAQEILSYERQNTQNLQRLIIDPIAKLYSIDIKQADSKKKDFDEESKEYYNYVSRYLGQRQDSLKEKKREESDSKYQLKRRNFELKRFDYSSYMHDLHNGRKDQEVLSQLTKYADAQAKAYLSAAARVEEMRPRLEALNFEVKEKDKEYQFWRREREEKRRVLEQSNKTYKEPDILPAPPSLFPTTPNEVNGTRSNSLAEGDGYGFGGSLNSSSNTLGPAFRANSLSPNQQRPLTSPRSQSALLVGSPNQNKFKGIRDLEERDRTNRDGSDSSDGQYRKEGLLWAMNRPGSHVDPKGLNKQAWHKFWIVLDQGKLSEYIHWKVRMELHMDPIDLRMASVREARNAERRFCFEVITPQFTRVYQATSEEDMRSWIGAINNALQSAFEGKTATDPIPTPTESFSSSSSTRRDIASVLTGKSSSLSSHRSSYAGHSSTTSKTPARHATVGDRPTHRNLEVNENTLKLLQQIRDADAGNTVCADCGADSKVDWVSINLGIVLCIECSGIHRSLGTHITKVRSLTLDTTSFTQDIIEVLLLIGNRVSNQVWEARLDRNTKPTPTSTREQRLHFITAKYSERAYVQPISSTLSHYASAEETLLASIKKNDIKNVLYGLALRANPNTTDRSRNTHAVFLALAAADPATPSPGVTPLSSPSYSGGATGGTKDRKPFPVAELLLQNGADIPPQPAPIPLSAAARLYLDQKAEQRLGTRPNPSFITPGADDDTLTALPSIVAGNSSTPTERAKERESKLHKRGSGGARIGRIVSGVVDGDGGRR